MSYHEDLDPSGEHADRLVDQAREDEQRQGSLEQRLVGDACKDVVREAEWIAHLAAHEAGQ